MNPVFHLVRICLEIHVGKFLQTSVPSSLRASIWMQKEVVAFSQPQQTFGIPFLTFGKTWYMVCTRWLPMHSFCLQWTNVFTFAFSEDTKWDAVRLLLLRTSQLNNPKLIQCCDKLLIDLGAKSHKHWGCHWKGSWRVFYRQQAPSVYLPAEETLDLRST